MGRAVLAVVLVGLVLLGAFMLTRESRSSTAASAREVPPAAEQQPAELVAPQAAPREAPVRTPVAENGAAPTDAHASAANTASLQFSGTVIAVDENGVQHPGEDGSFLLMLWSGRRTEPEPVTVHSGAWSLETPRQTRHGALEALGARGFEIGDRRTPDESGLQRFSLPASGAIDFRVRWLPRSVLHVRDRSSGAELDPVEVALTREWPETELARPGPETEVHELGRSPLDLDARMGRYRSGLCTVFARAPGHAWGRIQIDPAVGGERFLELMPGGDLEVMLDGNAPLQDSILTLSRAGEPLFEDQLHEGDSSVAIEGLAPGSLLVEVGAGEVWWWQPDLILGRAQAEIVAGKRTSVRVALGPQNRGATVPLDGLLVLPAEWKLEQASLRIVRIDRAGAAEAPALLIPGASMSRTSEPGVFAWEAEPLPPGSYEIGLDELPFHVPLEVGATGRHGVRIEVPPPCHVAVRCIDEDGGAEVIDQRVSWICSPSRRADPDCEGRAGWDWESHRWLIRAPVGRIDVQVTEGDYDGGRQELDVRPGRNEIDLLIARSCKLQPILRDGTITLPWEPDALPELEASSGEAGHVVRFRDEGRVVFRARRPGAYVLRVPPIPGYLPVPDEVVELEKGVVKKHVIELRRKP